MQYNVVYNQASWYTEWSQWHHMLAGGRIVNIPTRDRS